MLHAVLMSLNSFDVHVGVGVVQVLSTGAVVVDLPGVRDSNAARGAVAERYMKSCNAVWIVADITRAVDNRTAKVTDLFTVRLALHC